MIPTSNRSEPLLQVREAWDDMAWTEPEYTREEVNRAGNLFRKWYSHSQQLTPEEYERLSDAFQVINNWRSSHAYPLNAIQMNLRRSARRFDEGVLVAQRIKRLVSIGHKLDRFPKMQLTQMQDLGGCRAILRNVQDVRDLVDFFENVSEMNHERATYDNYVDNPKKSGYRGAHLVFRYRSGIAGNEKYNDLKVEMQLRSRYQHAWATAVETVGAFSGEALKSSLGSEQWQRFFSLMGSVIASREKTPLVPDTPTDRRTLLTEVHHYVETLRVVERLRGYRNAVKAMASPADKKASYFLLELNPTAGQLKVTGFGSRNVLEAAARYAEAEKIVRDEPSRDAVLVSVDSVNALSRAYPNYFADTRVFLQLLEQALSGHSRGIVVPAAPIEAEGKTPVSAA